MKKISRKESLRILNHLKKAQEILENASDGCDEFSMSDTEIAEDCLSVLSSIIYAINNAV